MNNIGRPFTGFGVSPKKIKRCWRCHNAGDIQSNGLCPRCDDALYGKKR